MFDSLSDVGRDRLEALTFFRVIAVTGFLGSAIAFDVSSISALSEARSTALLSLIVGTYLLTIVYAIVIRQIEDVRALSVVQVVLDVIITTTLIVITGGFQSMFIFVFHLNVVNAATVVGRRAGFAIAGCTSLVMLMLAGADVGALTRFFPVVESSGVAASSVWFNAVANSAAAFALAFLAGYLTDRVGEIRSELGEKEQDIQDLRALNANILNSMNSGVISVDPVGHVLFFNRSAVEITGIDESDALGSKLEALIPEMATQINALDAKEFERKETRYECGYRRDGKHRYLGFSLSPLESQSEKQGFIAIFQDLTEIKSMEQDVRRSERLASVGQLAASMAHEIRNPLASISGSVEMLEEASSARDEETVLFGIIIREVDRLNLLITDFLDYASPRTLEFESVHVGEALEEVLLLFEQHGDVNVVRDGDWDPSVMTERESLIQVIWNLLNNSRDALAGTEDPTIAISVERDETNVSVIVEDNGPGISKEALPHIFEPFFTTKPDGTGLGLAAIYRIVDDSGGSITVGTSALGGARFAVTLRGTE